MNKNFPPRHPVFFSEPTIFFLPGLFLALILPCFLGAATLRLLPGEEHQVIRGFGASGAWHEDEFLAFPEEEREAMARFLFDPEQGIGLSIYRARIDTAVVGTKEPEIFDPNHPGFVATGQFCSEYVSRYPVTFIAAPWTPPAWMKTNRDRKNGGELLPEFYPAYATLLADWVMRMEKNYGVRFEALSVQNEADSKKTWESCVWKAGQLRDFTRDHLLPALGQTGRTDLKIMLNEQTAWDDRTINEVLDDPVLAREVAMAAAHLYWGSHRTERQRPFETARKLGLEVWMTEFYFGDYLLRQGHQDDPDAASTRGAERFTPLDRTLALARIQHDSLTRAEVNAWLFWWMLAGSEKSVQSLITAEQPFRGESQSLHGFRINKWAYGLGQFSRFVRPGSVRLAAELAEAPPGLLATAFRRPDGRLVLVVLNESEEAISLTLESPLPSGSNWQAFRTSENEDLAGVSAFAEGCLQIAPRSITTLLGPKPEPAL